MEILAITCNQIAPVMRVVGYLINLLKIAIPIVLIVMVIVDLVKATVANDEKQMNNAKNAAGKRVIYALVIFLVPTVVSLLFKTLGNNIGGTELTGATEWISCFNQFI